jgi:hypothetical protein
VCYGQCPAAGASRQRRARTRTQTDCELRDFQAAVPAMMMAGWTMWKTPGRPTASSKARWAAVHRFPGRPRRRHRPPAGRLGARRWPEVGKPGEQSPDTVGTDTDSLRAREGATPQSAWIAGAPQALRTTFRGGRSLPRLTHGTGPNQPGIGSLGALAGEIRPQTARPATRNSAGLADDPEAEAEAEGETANRIPSQPPSRTEPGGYSSVAEIRTQSSHTRE